MDYLKSFQETLEPYHRHLMVGGAVVAAGVALHEVVRRSMSKRGPGSIKAPPGTAVIYQMGCGPNVPSVSPFPVKLQMYCRLAKIPYLVDATGRFSSKGKIPWITYNGESVEDSQLCIDYLNRKVGINLNGHLTKEQRAVARFIQVMVDEHLYWALALFRWVYSTPADTAKYLKVPYLAHRMVQKIVIKQATAQGIGRHSEQEVTAIMMEDLKRLSDFLGTKSFMFGEKMCEADCSVFGMLSQMIWHPPNDDMANLLKDKFRNLYQYTLRIKEQLWPDWDECCGKNKTSV